MAKGWQKKNGRTRGSPADGNRCKQAKLAGRHSWQARLSASAQHRGSPGRRVGIPTPCACVSGLEGEAPPSTRIRNTFGPTGRREFRRSVHHVQSQSLQDRHSHLMRVRELHDVRNPKENTNEWPVRLHRTADLHTDGGFQETALPTILFWFLLLLFISNFSVFSKFNIVHRRSNKNTIIFLSTLSYIFFHIS